MKLFLAVCTVFSILTFTISDAQQNSYIPKNKKEIEREKRELQKERKRIVSSGIYSVTTTKYQYKFGKPDKKGSLESTVRYNGDGNIVEEIAYNSIGEIKSRTTFRYNTKGNVFEEVLKRDENSFKTIHRYNTSGKRVETVYYKADGSIDKKITFIYDDHNLLLETIGYLDDGRVFQRDSYFYDSDGNVIEFKNNLNRFFYTYNADGAIATIEKYLRHFQVVDSTQYVLADRFLFEHDRNGNLISMIHERPDNTVRSHFRYAFNSAGQMTEEKEFNAEGRLMYTRRLAYDKNGNISEEQGTEAGKKFRHTYKYDSRGNKIEWTSFDQINEPQFVTKYTYNRYSSTQTENASVIFSDTAVLEIDETMLEEFRQLISGKIVAPDGSYLGAIVVDTMDSQSIMNAWGQYGFDESPTSIFNPSIPYGGPAGVFSPFNPTSPSPPSIYKDGKFFSYLTENENFRPRSSPKKLIQFLRNLPQPKK